MSKFTQGSFIGHGIIYNELKLEIMELILNDASKNQYKKEKRGGFIITMIKCMECGKDISYKANDKKIISTEQDFELEDN